MASKEKCGLKQEYDLVAPDGGWGYVICFSAVVIFVTTVGIIPCFGLMYKDLIEEIGMGTTEISLCNGINAMSFAVSGFFTSSLLRFMSKRQLAFISTVLYNSGNIGVAFINSVMAFYLLYVLQGIGLGALFNLTFAIINEYFEEKRLFATSVIQTFIGLLVMLLPNLIVFLSNLYGQRGSLIILTGVCLQTFIAVVLMQPVEWHMKKVPKKTTADEKHYLLTDDDKEPTVKLTNLKLYEESEIEPVNNTKELSRISRIINGMFDIPVIKMMVKTNVSWGIAIPAFADSFFLVILPQVLYHIKWDDDLVALALTLASLGDLGGRVFFTLFSRWIKLGNEELYILGMFLAVLSRIGLLFSTNKTMALASITLIGVSRCFLPLFFALIIAEKTGVDQFSSALGFAMILMGTSNLILGPMVGAIRDYTGSYNLTIWVLTALTGLCAVSWTIELVFKRLKPQKKTDILE